MEEWGKVIVKAPEDITAQFDADVIDALKQLATFASIDTKVIERSHATVDAIEGKGDFLMLSYDCSEWVDISVAFVSKGSDIEYYARHGDEYGTQSFYALTANGDKHGLQIDEGGDAMECEDYQDEMTEKLNAWKSAIPDAVKQMFPDFSAVEADDYIY